MSELSHWIALPCVGRERWSRKENEVLNEVIEAAGGELESHSKNNATPTQTPSHLRGSHDPGAAIIPQIRENHVSLI